MVIRLAITLGLLATFGAVPLAAQDQLAVARDLYASARYDEALNLLNTLKSADGQATLDRRSVEQYRSFCLIALGRSIEADAAIAAVITSDPQYQPDDTQVSPRVRSAFRDVRQRLLPDLAAKAYGTAKATFDRKEFDQAAAEFRHALGLLDDADMQGRLGDLRTLAAGFLDLSVAAATPPEPVKPVLPPPAPVPPPPAVPALPRVYALDDTNVMPPRVIRQDLPALPASIGAQVRNRGMLEVVINELGRVEAATLRLAVHPIYDAMVLAAVKDWRYQPARLGGKPVKYRKFIQISVSR